MYGLVNKAIQDMVLDAGGEQAWEHVKRDAGLQKLHIDHATNYDDQVSLDLVGSASQILNIPVDTLLFEFGRHWVRYTNKEGWSDHFKMSGDNLIACLKGLDEMHQRVRDAMPDANMPFFEVCLAGDDFYLDYHSTRTGFVSMVSGILEELCVFFNEQWLIEHQGGHSELSNCERFLLRRVDTRHES